MKKNLAFFLLVFSFYYGNAQLFGPGHHIKCYFTRPVDTTVAHAEKAVALIRVSGDTVVSYINRAKYTLDICMYDFVEDSTWFEHGYIANIALAINNAYARGVKIRWIANTIDTEYSPNTGIDSINPNIPVIYSPTGGSYGIMHNKIMIVDGRSSNPNDAIVWAGSENWEPGQIDKDANNILIIQDSGVAHCYLNEFNQMWGDTVEGGKPNVANEKFGPLKKTVPQHIFTVDGHEVEVYFSPTDMCSNHIVSTIEAAKSEVDFGVFEFSYNPDATALTTELNKGIYVAGIMDQYSNSYTPYTTLSSAMSNPPMETYYGVDSLFHHKYVIVDPCNMQADPMVLTGSHNWTTEAEDYNDENIMIIHDSTTANLFYQAFKREFNSLGGTLVEHCVPLGINELTDNQNITIYPNPVHTTLSVEIDNAVPDVTYKIFNIMGQQIDAGRFTPEYINNIDVSSLPTGMYVLMLQSDSKQVIRKFIKQ